MDRLTLAEFGRMRLSRRWQWCRWAVRGSGWRPCQSLGRGRTPPPWTPAGEPISSWSEDPGILKVITDPRDPRNSDDGRVGMFLMYGNALFGSKQWVRMPFARRAEPSPRQLYW